MTVFVREPHEASFGLTRHFLVADTIYELHQMADKLNLDRKYFNNDLVPNYLICKDRRDRAVQFGAMELTIQEMSAYCKTRRVSWLKERKSIANSGFPGCYKH